MHNKIINKIQKNGFAVIENVFTHKECNAAIKQIENVFKTRLQQNKGVGNKNVQVIFNYFLEKPSLLKFVDNKSINDIMRNLIDDDYVLNTTSARNVSLSKQEDLIEKKQSPGERWHRDNRIVGDRFCNPPVIYSAIICLDEFTKNNGCTLYIPNSHKSHEKINYSKIKKYKHLEASKGSIIFLDGNLIHKTGVPSKLRRWSIFVFYTPWFIKPGVNFKRMLGKNNKSDKLKKLFHFNSTVPSSSVKVPRPTLTKFKY